MRRSSSGARVSEGDGASASAHHDDTALPTYDPQSAAGRREAARARALERAVHCIPLVLLLCALVLWLSAAAVSPLVHLVVLAGNVQRSRKKKTDPIHVLTSTTIFSFSSSAVHLVVHGLGRYEYYLAWITRTPD